MKPPLAPLAAGCMAESGSRLPQSRDFADKAYDANWLRKLMVHTGGELICPHRRNRK